MENGSFPSTSTQDEAMEDLTEEETPFDSALPKRVAQVKEKYQEETYMWASKALELIFEFFPPEKRGKVVSEVVGVVSDLSKQELEHTRLIKLFDRFCRINPMKKIPEDFDFASEFKKFVKQEDDFTEDEYKSYHKYLSFMEKLKTLDKKIDDNSSEVI